MERDFLKEFGKCVWWSGFAVGGIVSCFILIIGLLFYFLWIG